MSVQFDPLLGQLTFRSGSGGSPTAPANRYEQMFDATTDWGSAVGGYYTITVLEATHLKDTSPTATFFQLVGSDYIEVDPDRILINTAGDISFRVTETPDLRFEGKIVII